MALGLIINSQSLDIPGAWKHNHSLRRLSSTVATRSESVPMPYVDGRTAFPARPDEIIVDLELQVIGRNDGTGTPHADKLAGLDANVNYLQAFVRSLADGATTTWPATLETRSGQTYTAGVQILNWQILQEHKTQVLIGYDVRVPSGVWTEVV